jgi:hypothetical protein
LRVIRPPDLIKSPSFWQPLQPGTVHVRVRVHIFKVLRERPDHAHHIIASVLHGLDRTHAIQIIRELAADSHWADDLAEVMGDGWAEGILAAPDSAPHLRALDERETHARVVAGLDPDAVAEPLLWEWAAQRGLIDDLGGMEWRRRHAGTDLAGHGWIVEHERIVRVLDGDLAGALVVGGGSRRRSFGLRVVCNPCFRDPGDREEEISPEPPNGRRKLLHA